MSEPRELGILLDNGKLVVGPGWTCIADVMESYHGFGSTRVYGTLVDAETLEPVYPQVIDGVGTGKD